MHVWSQWPDLVVPDGFTLHSGPLDDEVCRQIEFYAPRYTGAALDLNAVPRMPNLQVVQLPNAGFEDALVYARDGVRICNAKGVHDASTAELAVALTLASLRGIPEFVHAQERGEWSHARNSALADLSVAVIGFGSIGQRIARLFTALEAKVTPYSRTGSNGSRPISRLDDEIGQYDVIVLIAPATPETTHLIGTRQLRAMKKGALLVNVARGSLVDTPGLVEALMSGHVRAALDVTDPEPLPEHHPLWRAPNVLISPHVGGDTTAFAPRMRALIERQLAHLAAGEPLENVVHP
jgi:phosphoglycerate dehydrogenase-like enzyme